MQQRLGRVGGFEEVREVYGRLRESIRRIVMGKDEVVDLCLVSLLAGGHVLLMDIPGVGETTLAKTISQSIAVDFSRIQFTLDLLPSDITATSINDPEPASEGSYFAAGLSCSMPPWTPAHCRAGRPHRAMKPAAAASSKVLFGS